MEENQTQNLNFREDIFRLCGLCGISGRENSVAVLLEEKAKELGYIVHRDGLGNLCCQKEGEPDPLRPRLMVSAHMDEVGMMATYLEENGFVRFTCVGGIDPRVLPGRAVYLPRTGCYGVHRKSAGK